MLYRVLYNETGLVIGLALNPVSKEDVSFLHGMMLHWLKHGVVDCRDYKEGHCLTDGIRRELICLYDQRQKRGIEIVFQKRLRLIGYRKNEEAPGIAFIPAEFLKHQKAGTYL